MQAPPAAGLGRSAAGPSPRSTLAVSSASTLVIGILSGALGPFLPQLARRLDAPVEALGSMFTALFLGALIMQFAGGWLNERLGPRTMVVAGTALLALGVLGITASPSLAAILACAFLAGAGQGTIDISTNVLVPAVYGPGAVSALNVLHFAFGAGAVLSPILTSAALSAFGTPMPVLWMGAAVGLATALAALRWVMNVHPPAAEAHPAETRGLYSRPALWLLSLLMFLYVGVEMGVGGWTTVYAGRTTGLAPGAVAWLASGYWLALTAGRLLGAAAGARLSAHALARAAIAGSCLGGLMLLAGSGSVGWTVAGTVILGISFGPIFPTAVGLGNELFRDAPSRAVSVIIATSSLGGMVLPPLQGLLLERVSPRASVALVAAACLGMLGLLFAAERARPGRE